MKDEIAGGIKNALDRGYDLRTAVNSFISAGYSEKEVLEAAKEFTGVLDNPLQPTSQTYPQRVIQNNQIVMPNLSKPQGTMNKPLQPMQQTVYPTYSLGRKKASKTFIVILFLLLLLLAAGLVFVILYPDKILDLIR